MKDLASAFNSHYPGVKGFMQQVEHIGMTRYREEGEAYIETSMGRRLPADEGRGYTLVNYLIQGGAAEVFKLDILKADAAGLGNYLVVPVHDELVLSVPKEDATEIGHTLQECMTTRDGWSVPLLAGEASTGERWGDLSG
jgi:DNA polymerase-1